MLVLRPMLAALLLGTALATVPGTSVQAQGKPKKYAVTTDRAIVVTRDVLVRQGYEVVRIERSGTTQVVYYRRGNRGKGRGKGPVEKLVIRTVEERVVFEETAPAILVDIDVRLKL